MQMCIVLIERKKAETTAESSGRRREKKIKFIAVRLFHSIGKEWNVSESRNAQWEKGRQARSEEIENPFDDDDDVWKKDI